MSLRSGLTPASFHLPRRRAGFSLIELIAVLTLVSLLSAIAVPRYMSLRERAYVSAMEGDLYHLRLMQELHRRDGERPYVDDVSDLGEFFQASPDVEITIASAGPEGYTAIATHTGTTQMCTYSTDDAVTRCASAGEADESQPGLPADSAVGAR